MPFMTSAVQLDEFLVDMLRVDAAAPLSPAVSEHAVAVAGRPAVTAHEAAVLLRGAAAVGSLCLTAGLARICGSPALRHRDERTRNAALPGMVLPKLTRPMSDAGHPARWRQPGGSRHVCALLVAGGTQPSSNLPNPTPCSLTAGCIEKADPRKVGDMPLTCQGWQPFVPCTAVIDRLCCCAVTAVQKCILNGKLYHWPGSIPCVAAGRRRDVCGGGGGGRRAVAGGGPGAPPQLLVGRRTASRRVQVECNTTQEFNPKSYSVWKCQLHDKSGT